MIAILGAKVTILIYKTNKYSSQFKISSVAERRIINL